MSNSIRNLADTAGHAVAGVAGIDGVNYVALGASNGMPVLDVIAKVLIIVATSGKALVEVFGAVKNLFKKHKK